ncbi:carbohydrate ABC transporter permease [Eubacteriales bacterium OttesenSCG-928-A19]|nr:carbohydrate ABC transporter permease [Eubacteriales bacterium OttesenSCG-928-A19]
MLLLELLAIVLFVLFMLPFAIVLLNSAKTAQEIIFNPIAWPTSWAQLPANIRAILNNPTTDYIGAFFDSVLITFGALVVIILFSSMAAWVLVRNKKRWSQLLFMMFVAAMVVPFQVVMLPLVQWFRILGEFLHIQLLRSYPGIYLAYLGFGCSMTIFILHGFIKTVPLELEEAATIDGCGQAATFFRIVLPLLQPVVVTVLILNGIWIWNDYLLPLLLLGASGKIQTIPLAVTAFAGSYVKQWDLILTSALLAMLPIIILFIFAQKYIIKGMVEGSIK